MYNNRDISWLGFNHRVLMEAANESVPLMERVRFLSIFSSNLDEFFRVRFPLINVYAKLNDKLREKIVPPPDKDLLAKVQALIDSQLNEFGQIINQGILRSLDKEGIILYYNKPVPQEFRPELKEYFFSKILSFLQPVFIRKSLSEDFFPESNRQYFLVSAARSGEENLTHAFLNIPVKELGRFHSIYKDNKQHIFFIDDIIRENLAYVFSGYEINSCYSFKITRDAELNLDEENFKTSIIEEVEKKLIKRERGLPSRLLFEKGMPFAMQKLMANSFALTDKQLFEGGRYHNLNDLASLPVDRPDLSFAKHIPVKHKLLEDYADMFKQMENGDILLHFPYQSYNPVLSFFNQAAIDPDVKSIYVTLYRVASDSHIANALISAAKNKKDVTVFVELKARFDEANNIRWSKEMKRAGVKIIYSIPGVKVHSKIALVKKKKAQSDVNYAFIGTGNFNESTARFYTDHALFTTDARLTKDLDILFSALEKGSIPEKKSGIKFEHLLVAQNNMVEAFKKEIDEQIKRHKKGLPALIRIKINNLEDIGMIDALYKASSEGVPVYLIVRSICSIIPGKAGLSNNIVVKRIVDRYLEHSRIFIFGKGDEASAYIGSADWMTRNLHKRIEVVAPIYEKSLANELIDYFEIQWQDIVKAVEIDENGQQHKIEIYNNGDLPAQQKIYNYLNT